MVSPIDYTLKIGNPTQTMLGALSVGRGIADIRTQQAKQAGLEKAAAQSAAMQEELAALSKNPTSDAIAKMMVRYPQLSEELKRSHDVLSEKERNAQVSQASEVYAALQAGKPDLAIETLKRQAQAQANSGAPEDAKALNDLARLVELSPETAATTTGLYLASAMGNERFTDTYSKLESSRRAQQLEAPTLTKAQAEAEKAAVDSGFAESEAVLEMQKKGYDIEKLRVGIALDKENTKLARMQQIADKTKNKLKREELQLKIDAMKTTRDEKIRKNVAEVETARFNIDNMMNTIDRIIQTPSSTVYDAVGAWDGSWIGQQIDLVDQDVQSFVALLETLDSQAFLAQLPKMKGFGSLSDGEKSSLSTSLQSFNRKQEPAQFMRNMRETQRLLQKMRTGIAKKYGVPDTVPDTPFAEPTEVEFQEFYRKYAPESLGGGA